METVFKRIAKEQITKRLRKSLFIKKDKITALVSTKRKCLRGTLARKKCMTGIPLMSARYYTTLSMQETLLLRTNQLRPCVPRKDSISHFQSVKSFMAYMSQSLNTFYYCTKYRKFGKEGCSSHTIEARTVHEVVLTDIQKHAGQALTDRKAMVMEIAERFNL